MKQEQEMPNNRSQPPPGPRAVPEIINYIKICHRAISDELESIICLK